MLIQTVQVNPSYDIFPAATNTVRQRSYVARSSSAVGLINEREYSGAVAKEIQLLNMIAFIIVYTYILYIYK